MNKGFNGIRFAAVLIGLGLCMLIAMPSVLETLLVTRKLIFIKFTQSVKTESLAYYDKIEKESGDEPSNSCYIYNVVTDLGFDTEDKYMGWVLIDSSTRDVYATLYNDAYMIIGYKLTDENNDIKKYITDLDINNDELNAISLCKYAINCNTCIDETSGSNSIDNSDVDYSDLMSGEDFNVTLKQLVNKDITGSDEIVSEVKHIAYSDDIPDYAVSVNESNLTKETKAWYDNESGTIYFGSDAKTIYLSADSTNLFKGFTGLEDINLNIFNFSKVVIGSSMFQDCNSLKSLDLTNVNTNSMVFMNNMFRRCSSLTDVDFSYLNTSRVKTMVGAFSYLTSLSNVKLTGLDLSNVEKMDNLFEGSSSLEYVSLARVNISSLKSANYMFSGCSNLQTIYVSSDFDFKVNSSNMFKGCTRLSGSISYEDGKNDSSYASLNNGYFTLATE